MSKQAIEEQLSSSPAFDKELIAKSSTLEVEDEADDAASIKTIPGNSPKSELCDDFLHHRLQTLGARMKFKKDTFDQEFQAYEVALYLAEPGFHDLAANYHPQPMSSSLYPNSKKRHSSTNDDIYQNNHPPKRGPSLFFLKTDANPGNIYDEYYSTRALGVFCKLRPLVMCPRVYLTKKDGKIHILSEFIVSNGDREHDFADMPMFPYLAAIMLCRKDRDVNPKNYLRRTVISLPSQGQAEEVPIAARIDHGTELQAISRNPFANTTDVKQSVEALFVLTDIFENDLGLQHDGVKWDAYNLCYKTSFLPHIRRYKDGLFVIKDELGYLLFMRGICDFLETPEKMLDMMYLQEDRPIGRRLKEDFQRTQTEVHEIFAKEIARFHEMIQQEPWKSINPEYMAPLPFDRVLANYPEVCHEYGYDNVFLSDSEVVVLGADDLSEHVEESDSPDTQTSPLLARKADIRPDLGSKTSGNSFG